MVVKPFKEQIKEKTERLNENIAGLIPCVHKYLFHNSVFVMSTNHRLQPCKVSLGRFKEVGS